jgi:protocatechuate 3,4-dioxygenase alpha subunit|tara:strand:+ start:12937 stop:13476 length:540 start_codon:yes stop_codon:yes gene_type:complete
MSNTSLKETPSQTAGPYVHIGLMPQVAGLAVPPELGRLDRASQGSVRLQGHVWDGEGAPVKDVVIEVWQHDPSGPGQWQRVASDFDTGVCTFEAVKTGVTVGSAPHLNLWIVARGINIGLNTRLYFADEDAANATDAVMQAVDPARRATLLAVPMTDEPVTYEFEIRLQGENETVFFDV